MSCRHGLDHLTSASTNLGFNAPARQCHCAPQLRAVRRPGFGADRRTDVLESHVPVVDTAAGVQVATVIGH